jgi:hypothetical protein
MIISHLFVTTSAADRSQKVGLFLRESGHSVNRLESTDNRVLSPRSFITRLVEFNTPVPDGFEPSAKRLARGEKVRLEHARHTRTRENS